MGCSATGSTGCWGVDKASAPILCNSLQTPFLQVPVILCSGPAKTTRAAAALCGNEHIPSPFMVNEFEKHLDYPYAVLRSERRLPLAATPFEV